MRIPAKPRDLRTLMEELGPNIAKLLQPDLDLQLPPNRYLHWDSVKHREPPKNLTHEEWWCAIKFHRLGSMNSLPFLAKDQKPFVYGMQPFIQRMLHLVDRDASGRIELPEVVTSPHTRDRFLVRSLIEEAITSSQLEGAATTRSEAKKMLRQGRRPRNRSEQMILNNYHAMEFIRDISKEDLTKDKILELHTVLMHDTMDNPSAVGRWRNSDERVSVVDQRDEAVLHVPPPAEELEERMTCLLDFANAGTASQEQFIHPVLRSILIHFMIGYDHPFFDGNGRTARALFYWSMAKHGYWMMEFISISTILRNAPSKYARAYLYSETDERDTTYFIDYQLKVILRAIKSLHDYLLNKTAEIRQADGWLRGTLRSLLNHRQISWIQHALKHPYDEYTVKSHMRSHAVTYETARSDLLALVDMGLVNKNTRGRAYVFHAVEDLSERLKDLRPAR